MLTQMSLTTSYLSEIDIPWIRCRGIQTSKSKKKINKKYFSPRQHRFFSPFSKNSPLVTTPSCTPFSNFSKLASTQKGRTDKSTFDSSSPIDFSTNNKKVSLI